MRRHRQSTAVIKPGCSLEERRVAALEQDRAWAEWLSVNCWYLVEEWQDSAFSRPPRCQKKIIREGLLSFEDYKHHNHHNP